MSGMCPGQNCQFQHVLNVAVTNVSFSIALTECVVVKNVSFSTAGMCNGQKRIFQHSWNVLWSKMSVLAWLNYVLVKNVTFSMSGMCCGQNL
jgi:hypothetical protein